MKPAEARRRAKRRTPAFSTWNRCVSHPATSTKASGPASPPKPGKRRRSKQIESEARRQLHNGQVRTKNCPHLGSRSWPVAGHVETDARSVRETPEGGDSARPKQTHHAKTNTPTRPRPKPPRRPPKNRAATGAYLTLVTSVMTAPEIADALPPAPPAESAPPADAAPPAVSAPDTEPADLPAGTFSASAIAREHATNAETVVRIARAMGLAPAGDEPLHSWQISETDARKLAIAISIHQHFSRWEQANRAAKKVALMKALCATPGTAPDVAAIITEATRDLPEAGPNIDGFPSGGEAFAKAFIARRAGNEVASDIFDECINPTVAALADMGRDFACARNPQAEILDTEAALDALLCELERGAGLAPASVVAETLPSDPAAGSILEQYRSMKPGPERQKFFSEHKAKIVAAHKPTNYHADSHTTPPRRTRRPEPQPTRRQPAATLANRRAGSCRH